MAHLEMLPGEKADESEAVVCHRKINVRPKHGGLIQTLVRAGDRVTKGQLLAEIYDPYTFEKREELKAPVSGFVSRQQVYPTVHTGERAFHVLEVPGS